MNQILIDGSAAVSVCQSKLSHGLIVHRDLSESARWKLEIQYFLKIQPWRAKDPSVTSHESLGKAETFS